MMYMAQIRNIFLYFTPSIFIFVESIWVSKTLTKKLREMAMWKFGEARIWDSKIW